MILIIFFKTNELKCSKSTDTCTTTEDLEKISVDSRAGEKSLTPFLTAFLFILFSML